MFYRRRHYFAVKNQYLRRSASSLGIGLYFFTMKTHKAFTLEKEGITSQLSLKKSVFDIIWQI